MVKGILALVRYEEHIHSSTLFTLVLPISDESFHVYLQSAMMYPPWYSLLLFDAASSSSMSTTYQKLTLFEEKTKLARFDLFSFFCSMLYSHHGCYIYNSRTGSNDSITIYDPLSRISFFWRKYCICINEIILDCYCKI